MLPDIFQILSNNVTVQNLISSRVYRHGEAPQGVALPYITWHVITGLPENNLSSVPDMDKLSIHIDNWSETDTGIVELAKAVRDAIEPYAHMIDIPVNERDEKTKNYRIGLEFDWFLGRS